jgi:hypothetical protein
LAASLEEGNVGLDRHHLDDAPGMDVLDACLGVGPILDHLGHAFAEVLGGSGLDGGVARDHERYRTDGLARCQVQDRGRIRQSAGSVLSVGRTRPSALSVLRIVN